MSIRAKIAELVVAERLVQWMPEHGEEHRRHLFLSPEVAREMDPSVWLDQQMAIRFGELAADFNRFTSDPVLPVGMDPYRKDKSAFLARVHPVEARVWSLRSRAPRPSIRLVGLFAEKDVLILILSRFRDDLGGPKDTRWAWVREEAAAWWNDHFAPERALLSEDANDYVSGFFQV